MDQSTEKLTAIDMPSHTEIEEMDGRKVDKGKENHGVVELIEGKLNAKHSGSFDWSFGRVPEMLLRQNPEAYKPQIVSIGPFHHGQKHLHPMEALKIEYLQNFLDRSCSAKLENYVEAVTDSAERAYQCYPETKIERNRFVMMMVVDGCFIFELLLKYKEGTLFNESIVKLTPVVFVDLITLENQLPFFILEELYQVFKFNGATENSCSFQELICSTLLSFIMGLLVGKLPRLLQRSPSLEERPKPRHLLDCLRQVLIPSSPLSVLQVIEERIEGEKQNDNYDKMKEQKAVGRATKRLLEYCISPCRCVRWLCGVQEDYPGLVHSTSINLIEPMLCATELNNGNVKFEINKDSTCLSDIKFDNAKGVLAISPIFVSNATEPIIRNLLAHEIYVHDYAYITEYMVFLTRLISSAKDVELLIERGILMVPAKDPEEVAKLFDDVTRGFPFYTEYTDPIRIELMKYYNIRWHKWKAGLRLNYFNTPWSSISVVAAIILLLLTVMQTIYAALSYHY